MGDGFNHSVYAITSNGSAVYAGGDFTQSGTSTVEHVARWDGSGWSQAGDGISQSVGALVFDSSGNLYAGYSFTDMVSRWDGASWSVVGGGVVGSGCPFVGSLAADGTSIYAGGSFQTTGGVSAENIAVWGKK
jgi:hypothetical protein